MIVVVLILILAGSFTGAGVVWMHEGSLWQIALGYVGGGWAGLLLGLPVVVVVRVIAGLPLRSSPSKKRLREHP